MENLIRPEELAAKLGVKLGTVYKWKYLGKIPSEAVVKAGRLLRFKPEVIRKIMDGTLQIGGKK